MTKENVCPACTALTIPMNEQEAVSRVSECMRENEYGLIGSIYSSLDQFKNGMEIWHIDLETPIFENETATTWLLRCVNVMKTRREIQVLLHQWAGGHVQVLNVRKIQTENLEPVIHKEPKQNADDLQLQPLPWEKKK